MFWGNGSISCYISFIYPVTCNQREIGSPKLHPIGLMLGHQEKIKKRSRGQGYFLILNTLDSDRLQQRRFSVHKSFSREMYPLGFIVPTILIHNVSALKSTQKNMESDHVHSKSCPTSRRGEKMHSSLAAKTQK